MSFNYTQHRVTFSLTCLSNNRIIIVIATPNRHINSMLTSKMSYLNERHVYNFIYYSEEYRTRPPMISKMKRMMPIILLVSLRSSPVFMITWRRNVTR